MLFVINLYFVSHLPHKFPTSLSVKESNPSPSSQTVYYALPILSLFDISSWESLRFVSAESGQVTS